MLEGISRNIFPLNKRISRSQSHTLLEPRFNKNPTQNFITSTINSLLTSNTNNKNPLITSVPNKNKIILPKINFIKSPKLPDINFVKNETIEDLLKKFSNDSTQENSKDINSAMNKEKELEFFFKNIKPKKTRNKLKKVQFKKHISSIEEIKRRNREIRRKKEKLENELFEMRQREAKKLMASFKVELDGNNKMRRKVGKRYTLFKEILIYLESNNITLNQMAMNDPFQHEPYMIPKSYEFFTAVKFKNYDYVIQALNANEKYLFSIDYFGQTAYHWAAKLGDLKMLQILMDYGLYHNQKDYKGRTPLYLAAMNNHKDICYYLLNKGGNIYLKDKNGLTPADVAGSKEMKSFLMDFISQPFSNPIYKARIKQVLLDREEKIKLRESQKQKENMIKNNKKLLNEENNELNDDNNDTN